MGIVVMEIEREEGSAVVRGVVGASISPLPSDGLDETFGLAVGLWAIGFSEAMFEAQLLARGGKEFGAIGRAAIGEDALDVDAVGLVEGDGLVESGENAGSFFVWEETGKSDSGMIIDGDVEGFGPCARIAMGTIAGGANARLVKTAKLFNIKMKELAWSSPFVTDDWRLRGIESGEAVEAVPLEDAGKGSFRDGKDHQDLSVGTALFAEREDLNFELGSGLAWLVERDGGTILQAQRVAGLMGAREPLANGFIGDAEGSGGGAQRGARSEVVMNQFGSHEWSERGISVHSDPEE